MKAQIVISSTLLKIIIMYTQSHIMTLFSARGPVKLFLISFLDLIFYKIFNGICKFVYFRLGYINETTHIYLIYLA